MTIIVNNSYAVFINPWPIHEGMVLILCVYPVFPKVGAIRVFYDVDFVEMLYSKVLATLADCVRCFLASFSMYKRQRLQRNPWRKCAGT